jgi:hypothetical protein
MAVLEALLALIGLGLLVLLAIGGFANKTDIAPPHEDAAAPYREGLHAAIHMQRVAQDLERRIFSEAARYMAADDPGTQLVEP